MKLEELENSKEELKNQYKQAAQEFEITQEQNLQKIKSIYQEEKDRLEK